MACRNCKGWKRARDEARKAADQWAGIARQREREANELRRELESERTISSGWEMVARDAGTKLRELAAAQGMRLSDLPDALGETGAER